MSNCITLLFFSFALFVSCGKAGGTYAADAGTTIAATCVGDSSILFADPILKERYLAIEERIGFYVAELEKIEKLYYTENVSSDSLVRLSVTGFELQEELRDYIKSIISDNIGNSLGMYMLVVYEELFTTAELQSLIREIPISAIDGNNSYLYNMIMSIATERNI